MDPNVSSSNTPTSSTPNPTPPVQPSGTSPSAHYSGSNYLKKVLVGIVVVVIVVVGSLLLLLGRKPKTQTNNYPHYKFTINGQEVPKDDFVAIYKYYKSQDGSAFNKTSRLSSIENMYIEDYLLKQEFIKEGLSFSKLESSVEKYQFPSSLSSAPDPLKKINSEDTIMRGQLLPMIGIKSRTGEILKLSAPISSNPAQLKGTEDFMVQKLSQYKTLFDNKSPFTYVKNSFLADVSIKNNPSVHAGTISFIKMTPFQPVIARDEFINAAFSTNKDSMSNIFKIMTPDTLLYGLVYISDTTGGQYDDYRVWLQQKTKAVAINTNFSDF